MSKKRLEYTLDFVAGLAGGSAGLIVGHPFDTVKVFQQLSRRQSSMFQTAKRIAKAHMFRGFFQGMGFPLASVGFLNSIFFGSYGNTVRFLGWARRGKPDDKGDLFDTFIAAAVGGGIQAVPCTTIELVKVRLQGQLLAQAAAATAQKDYIGPHYRGPVDCVRTIFREEGLRGCFRGLPITVMRDMTGFSMYMTSYEVMRRNWTPDGEQPSYKTELLAGGLAGVFSWVINIQMDVVKTRLQQDGIRRTRYVGMVDCVRQAVHQEGSMALWRGLTTTCTRAFPVNAVTLCVYSKSLESMKVAYGKRYGGKEEW